MITMNQSIENQLRPANEAGTDRMCFEDEAGFNEIVRCYSTKLLTIVTYITRSRQTAEDIVQETFIAVWKNISSFRNEAGINTWIFRIATNNCLKAVSKSKRKKLVDQDSRFFCT